MRFLADESCDFRVVRALRTTGHDVTAVIETAPGAEDEVLVALAIREQRVLLTEDRDFGRLTYATAAAQPATVILMRFPSTARATLPAAIVDFIDKHGSGLDGRFVVVEPGRIRIGGRP
jgi:predicted nuclease of predicted toxin-antitoxin system